jgi:hypothetical protein
MRSTDVFPPRALTLDSTLTQNARSHMTLTVRVRMA